MVSKEQIDEIVRLMVASCRPEKIILFGSYARNHADEASDLDLAIIQDTPLPSFKRAASFRKAIRSGGKRWLFPMDILVFTPEEVGLFQADPASLVHEIMNTGKVLYESK